MSVSILIPTYNRTKFSQLISLNIMTQTYPLIKEILIADDGENKLTIDTTIKTTILYFQVERMSIGKKRNFLKSKADGDYLVHMDTDDFYNPDYISNCIFNLLLTGKQLTGSSDMIMYNKNNTFKQSCIYINYINEATMVYTKEYAKNNNFSETNAGEGVSFCIPKFITDTRIDDIMVCICHNSITVDKNTWLLEKYKINFNMDKYIKHLELLSTIDDI